MGFGSGGTVKKVAAVGACALVLQACALPVPLKIASWALDGVSYLATKKSLTDHGLSMVAQQDCAMLRGLKGEEICRDDAPGTDGAVVVALAARTEAEKTEASLAAASTDAMPAGGQPLKAESWTAPAMAEAVSEADAARTAASFDTAAGGSDVIQADALPVVRPTADLEVKTEPWGELYYVIASFRELDRADLVLQRYPHLELRVLTGVLDGAEVFRVAAGPFRSGEGLGVKKLIRDAGLRNAWAVRMPSSRWSTARMPSSDRQLAAVPGNDTVTVD